jgi:hypothetical protein
MAHMLSTDITIDIFKGLPEEIKKQIICKIPINKLISPMDTTVEPLIDEYIRYYIDHSLLTNASIFTFLHNTKLYSGMVDAKIKELAINCAREYIQQTKLFEVAHKNDNGIIDRKMTRLCLNIKYYNGPDEHIYYTIFNRPKQKPIRCGFEYSINNHYHIFSCIRDDSVREGPYLNEIGVSGEIMSIFFHFMNGYKNIYGVHSIEITEETLTEEHVFNETVPDVNVIKKYY